MKKLILVLLVIISCLRDAGAQQFALYNSRTLYDAFENPSQKAFQADSSRKYAFNFLIPTISASMAFTGPAENNFKTLIYSNFFDGRNINLGDKQDNILTGSTNTYLAMFRIFKTVSLNREMGFSWQVKSDGRLKVSNESLAIFDNYKLFNQSQYLDIFNNSGYNQSYHQFSFSYREDYDKRLSIGVKLSLLSGITYNKLKVEESQLNINRSTDQIDIKLRGLLRSSFLTSEVSKKTFYPTFKMPGLALGASASYKFKEGWFLLGNIKDIGFIRWSKSSDDYSFNKTLTIDKASDGTADERLNSAIGKMINDSSVPTSFTTVINGKAEALLNKDLGKYQPNLLLSKNLFYPGGDVSLINNYRIKNKVLTATANYNSNKILQIGGQFMVKTPNSEFFIGSDQLFKTVEATRSLLQESTDYKKGYSGASIYLGFAAKFGPAMEHSANANSIPGFQNPLNDRPGFFKRLFSGKN